jgi:hypothetical protein
MSLLKLLGTEFNPTATFSFEFFKRMTVNSKDLLVPIREIFFLLPPETYSLQEGYKITVTKTADGAFIDDFGNDLKRLRLSGSLYSYYQGFPGTNARIDSNTGNIAAQSGGDRIAQEFVNRNALEASGALASFGINVPGLGGLTGLDEFFKLRWLVSRFRDQYIMPAAVGETKKFPNTPDQSTKDLSIILDSMQGQVLFDKIAVVYHDYDDNNHFEVVFNNFSMRRSKEDPFTIFYDIDLICTREVQSNFLGAGKSVQKENPVDVLKFFVSESIDLTVGLAEEASKLPLQLVNQLQEILTLNDEIVADVQKVISNTSSNIDTFLSKIDNLFAKNEVFAQNLFETTTDADFQDYLDENVEMPDEFKQMNSYINKLQSNLSNLKGSDKYFANEETEKTYTFADRTLEDSDFTSDEEQKQENVFVSRNTVFHTVTQGETLKSIANLFYADYSKASLISDANDLTNRDFENDAMVGKSIIIPLEYKSSFNLPSNNLVYATKLKSSTQRERQLQILGTDFKLTNDRKFVADGTGDIALVYGAEAYLENIKDRSSYPKGTLSPLHPTWGISLSIGDAPGQLRLRKLIDDIEAQMNNDPRTQSAYVDVGNLDVEADVVRVPTKIKPFTGEESTVDMGKGANNLFSK